MGRAAVRRTLGLGTAGVLLVMGVAGGSARAATVSVQTTAANRFQPATVTLNRNDTVNWTNNGGVNHTVTSTSPNWAKNDQLPVQGTSTTFTFSQPGTYTYQCNTHASAGMRGTVVVRAPSPSPTRTSARPTPPPTPSPSASSPQPSPTRTSARPTPTRTSASPTRTAVALPTDRPPATRTPGGETLIPQPSRSVSLGSGGLTPQQPTDRGRGLLVLLAVLVVGGLASAEIRALLAETPRR